MFAKKNIYIYIYISELVLLAHVKTKKVNYYTTAYIYIYIYMQGGEPPMDRYTNMYPIYDYVFFIFGGEPPPPHTLNIKQRENKHACQKQLTQKTEPA